MLPFFFINCHVLKCWSQPNFFLSKFSFTSLFKSVSNYFTLVHIKSSDKSFRNICWGEYSARYYQMSVYGLLWFTVINLFWLRSWHMLFNTTSRLISGKYDNPKFFKPTPPPYTQIFVNICLLVSFGCYSTWNGLEMFSNK